MPSASCGPGFRGGSCTVYVAFVSRQCTWPTWSSVCANAPMAIDTTRRRSSHGTRSSTQDTASSAAAYASSEAAPAAHDVAEPDDPRAAPVGGGAAWPETDERSDTAAAPSAAVPSPATNRTAPSTTSSGADAHQLPLIGAVALSRRPDPVVASEAAESLVELRLFGHQTSLVRGQEATQQQHSSALRKYRRAWSLLLAIAALPDTKASVTRIGELLWQQAGDDLDLLSNRIQSNLSNARQVLQAAGLTAD